MTDVKILDSSSSKPNVHTECHYGETRTKVKEVVFTWTIKNASKCFKQVGECFKSPRYSTKFEDKSSCWDILFYPNGSDKAHESYTSLKLFENILREALTIYVKICIIDKTETECVLFKNFVTLSKTSKETLIVNDFVPKSKLPELFSKNGDLKIICKLYYNTGSSISSISSKPVLPTSEKTRLNRQIAELNAFEKLLEDPKFSDVKLVTNSMELIAHKNILSARSSVFAAMFEHEMKESQDNVVTIIDVDGEIMKEVLRFIYVGRVNDLETNADKLLAAADKYELNGLKTMCEEILIAILGDKTVRDILLLVDRHDAGKLRAATIEYITRNASKLSSDDSFNVVLKCLSPSLLTLVIKALMSKD